MNEFPFLPRRGNSFDCKLYIKDTKNKGKYVTQITDG
jgi:hypothetical protein